MGRWRRRFRDPLHEDYFEGVDGRAIEFGRDCMAPFLHRVADTVCAVRNDWLIFAEVDPFGAMRGVTFPDNCPERTVNTSHWYDLATLVPSRASAVRSPMQCKAISSARVTIAAKNASNSLTSPTQRLTL